MQAPATAWNLEPLRRALHERLPGITVELEASVGSTNTALLARLREARGGDAGAAVPQPCLLVAERQTAGRGRLGREWRSEPGASLTFSLATPLARADWSGLSLAVGVAIAGALEPAAGASPRVWLKWPNDLWLVDADGGGRKLGGILIETVAVGGTPVAVIGIGLNVAPIDVGDVAVASVRELDPAATAPDLLARVAPALADAVLAFAADGFARFADRFARRDLLRGRRVTTTERAASEGEADGVEADGALRLRRSDGSIAIVRSGDVSVRPAGAGGAGPC